MTSETLPDTRPAPHPDTAPGPWHPGPGRGHVGPTPETVRRIAAINAMRAEGRSLASIGRELGISRQRVSQIVSRGPDGSTYPWSGGVLSQRASAAKRRRLVR